MGTIIHPTAIIDASVELGENVQVGPYSVIKDKVVIGDGTIIKERVSIEGNTTIGKENVIFAGAVIGSPTQDKKFAGGDTYLRIGDRNNIREYVTMNPGTEDGTETRVGSDNLFMAYSHIAHDCIVHDNVILANVATLAGHVEVESGAIIGGLSAVHQFVRIGTVSITGGCSKVVQDIPPYMSVAGHPVSAFSINSVGLDRRGVSAEVKRELKRAYKIIFRQRLSTKSAIAEIRETLSQCDEIKTLVAFLESTQRGICK